MSEFIGSRISLISKSDIKYVGTLHEINSETSTVALENVKSYGTEGRRGNPDEEIPPSDQIYEYIVFRGSDVKDLTIIEQAPKDQHKQPQMPNDPAILGSARPPQQQQQQQQHQQQQQQQQPQQGGQNQQWRGPPPPQNFPPYGGDFNQQNSRFAPPGGPHGFPGAPGAVPGYGMNFGGPPPPGWGPPPGHGFPQGPGHGFPQGPPGGQGHFPQQHQQGPPGAPSPLQENQRPGQKSQQGPRQQSGGQPQTLPNESKPTELSATPAPGSAAEPSIPSGPKDVKSDIPGAPKEPKAAKTSAPVQKNQRVAVPLAARSAAQDSSKPIGQSQPTSNTTQSTQNATEAAAAAVAAAMAKLGPVSGKPAAQTSSGQTGQVDNLTRKVSEMSTSDSTRGRGGQRGSVQTRGTRGPRRGGGAPRQTVDVPTTDFDFESSNAKFNKNDLLKEATGTPTEEITENGLNGNTATTPSAIDNAEDEVVIPGAAAKKYDKTSSFFDNLSSELKDRQTAQEAGSRLGGAEFRSEERKRNMETFGESSPFRGRGGMRGGAGRGFAGRGRGYARGGRGQGQGQGRGEFRGQGGRGGGTLAEV